MMGPRIHQIDNVDKMPPAAPREAPPWGTPATRRAADWRVVAVCWIGGLVALLLIWWLIGDDVRAWVRDGEGGMVLRVLIWGPIVGGALFALRRWLLIEQPGGFRLLLWQTARADGASVIDRALDVQEGYATTQFRNTVAYTLTNPAPALPAPEEADVIEAGPDVGPLPRDTWLAWLDAQPHALFAAKTGKGKSTIAKAGLKLRIAGGEQVFVIDPHSNGWFELPGVGGGENWHVVEDAIAAVVALYRERLQARERYKKETGRELDQSHFPRLTVVLDEANLARDHFTAAYKGSRKAVSPWELFADVLGSGARKTGISVWLLAQSALVEDLGMSGAKRENFTRFALDRRTILDLADRDERDAARRKAIVAALSTAGEWAAAAIVKDDLYLLDRTGLDTVSPPANSARAAWQGWDYTQDCPAQRQLAQTGPVFPPWCQSVEARIIYLAKTTTMSTRDIRAALNCDYNLVVDLCRRYRTHRAACTASGPDT